jgi:hypothetical protein
MAFSLGKKRNEEAFLRRVSILEIVLQVNDYFVGEKDAKVGRVSNCQRTVLPKIT